MTELSSEVKMLLKNNATSTICPPIHEVKAMNYGDIITIEPGKRGGKPCIRGMRITVYDVLEYLAAGMSHQEILEDFPYLTEDDIRACLSYAADREKMLMVVKA
jgi:uncharacterized protein (DUF433 family)